MLFLQPIHGSSVMIEEMIAVVSEGLSGLDAGTQAKLLVGLQILFFLAAFRVLWLLRMTRRIQFVAPKKRRAGKPVHYLGFLYFVVCLLFAGTLLYQSTWHLMGVLRPEFVSFMKRYDRRLFNPAHQLNRGRILDRNGKVLAENRRGKKGVERRYPLGAKASHVVGYLHPVYGLNGIEKALEGSLAGTRAESVEDWEQLGKSILTQNKSAGGKDLRLTLDARLQSKAYELLGRRTGAVIVMGVRSGALYVVCSRPSFDPHQLDGRLFTSSGRQAPLLNRALRGLYPPGSTFKVAVGAAAMERGLPDVIECGRGVATSSGVKPIRDHVYYERRKQNRTWGGYGKIGMGTAMAESSNVYFASLGVRLGHAGFQSIGERMGFNQGITVLEGADGTIEAAPSQLPRLAPRDQYGLAQMGIGQGQVTATPLQMALITAAVANSGVAPSPRLLARQEPKSRGRFMAAATADKLAVLLRRVVTDGTAKRAAQLRWALAGKTGTAENGRGPSHSWFTGYFPFELPQFVVCVVVEHGGYGSATALPVAMGIIEEAGRLGLIQVPAEQG
tara:strand:- start:124 stop:1800 length:1677 start_codon:yes stop_codon:yes gene_type:complete